MAKPTKKRRNKPYRGEDAAQAAPTIHRYTAVKRNPIQQWWFDNKKIAKPVLIAGAAVLVLVWLIVESVKIVF